MISGNGGGADTAHSNYLRFQRSYIGVGMTVGAGTILSNAGIIVRRGAVSSMAPAEVSVSGTLTNGIRSEDNDDNSNRFSLFYRGRF